MKYSLTLALVILALSACSMPAKRNVASEKERADISFYQNVEEGCGAIVGPETTSLDSMYKFKAYKSDGSVVTQVGAPGTLERAGYFEAAEIRYSKKYMAKLAKEGKSNLFEIYLIKQGIFGPKRKETYCDEMSVVPAEDFMFNTNF